MTTLTIIAIYSSNLFPAFIKSTRPIERSTRQQLWTLVNVVVIASLYFLNSNEPTAEICRLGPIENSLLQLSGPISLSIRQFCLRWRYRTQWATLTSCVHYTTVQRTEVQVYPDTRRLSMMFEITSRHQYFGIKFESIRRLLPLKSGRTISCAEWAACSDIKFVMYLVIYNLKCVYPVL